MTKQVLLAFNFACKKSAAIESDLYLIYVYTHTGAVGIQLCLQKIRSNRIRPVFILCVHTYRCYWHSTPVFLSLIMCISNITDFCWHFSFYQVCLCMLKGDGGRGG